MATSASALHRSGKFDPSNAWQLVVRTAIGVSILSVAVVYALHTFIHTGDTVAVLLVGAGGLLIGSRLPAAQPPIPRWLMDESDDADHLAP